MDISSSSLKTSISSFISRFHGLIFTIIILGGLIVCMLLINDIIHKSTDSTGYTPTGTDTTFDQATIDRISRLHTSTDTSNGSGLDLSGRINPFVD